MESDEDDGQGVYLDPKGYAYRDGRQRGYAGDELYFTGYDMGHQRRESYPNAYYGNGDSEEDAYYGGGYRGRDEALAQSAYERMAKARASGQTNISLSVDEMEAIERRRGVQQPAPVQPPLQIASPPATPVKTPKGKSSSRNNSSVSLSSTKAKKKGSSLFGGGPSTPPSKSKSKSKSGRKMSISSDQAAPFSPGAPPPPGYLVAGPNGMPMYAPMPYYPPPSPELARAQASRDRSRSTSKHNRRGSTPPEPVYAQYSPARFYPPPAGMRPGSSSSNRSFHDEAADWYPPQPPPGRARASSNAQYRMPPPPDDYTGPPAAHGRRSLGGPATAADINYSSLRRIPPGSSPLAAAHHYSDPAVAGRKGSGLSQEVGGDTTTGSSGSSSGSGSGSEDQGVTVEVHADGGRGNGYSVSGSGAKTAVKGNEARRRKGRR